MSEDLLKHLEEVHFDKYFEKLKRKLKNKKIIVYGSGSLFQLIKEKNDLSELNIIGISDKKFVQEQEGEDLLGYKIVPKDKIVEYAPDFVIVATLNYVGIIESFVCNTFKNTKIKVIPLVKRPLLDLLKEIWCK